MSSYPQCPLPIAHYPKVSLAHGGGGRLMHNLIEGIFYSAFGNDYLHARHDSAVLEITGKRIVTTCDSFVVSPRRFPGGSIGTLAVYGTVNDLAMSGAVPLYLTAAFVLEEGLELEELWQVACDMRAAADEAGVYIVSGDTKVVERGKGDGLFISTSGIGRLDSDLQITPASVRAGDCIILSGDIGRHGIAVLSVREGLRFETEISSDCANLAFAVQSMLKDGIDVHCLRDLTRGGLASALVEISAAAGVSMIIEEDSLPIDPAVRGACEMLGLDPLYVANEGRFIAIVAADDADKCIARLREHQVSRDAACIGRVEAKSSYPVALKQSFGSSRILDLLSGEQLPRIC